jgi:uncharacterized membrane protein YcaP (DUF421 family)
LPLGFWQTEGQVAIATILRAIFGYCFLIFMARIVGRRPGKQLTPFEFVLIFYLGGLTLTGMVGDEVSISNAICQIIAVAACHYVITQVRAHSPRVARLLDGTPLTLLESGQWRAQTLRAMGILDDDVMAMARDQGVKNLEQIDVATLERNGEISIIKKQPGK